MKRNVGTTDKIIRIILAAVIATLALTGVLSGTLGVVMLVFALILVATSLFSFCGIYTLFGINTCKAKK